ncbi:MAG: DUF333 domain-containing protein [Candidatus Sericytochromatia bacterium]
MRPWGLLVLLAVSTACTPQIMLWPTGNAAPSASPSSGLANPATAFCEQNNGRTLIRNSTQGQFGYCVFNDRSACEEWSFYRQQCYPGDNPNFL